MLDVAINGNPQRSDKPPMRILFLVCGATAAFFIGGFVGVYAAVGATIASTSLGLLAPAPYYYLFPTVGNLVGSLGGVTLTLWLFWKKHPPRSN